MEKRHIMTRINEVVQQIEIVIDDTEYPVTLNELLVLKKILEEITRQRSQETAPSTEPLLVAVVTPRQRSVPVRVYDLLRNYERQRNVPGIARSNPDIPYHNLNMRTIPVLSTG